MAVAAQNSVRGLGCSLSNVREVYQVDNGVWICTVDLHHDDGDIDSVEYVANERDTMHTGQWVVARIKAGLAGPIGTAADYEAWKTAKEQAEWVAKPSDEQVAELKAHVASLRYDREVAGTTWNGLPVHTDRDSQSKVQAERLAITTGDRQDGDAWKFADGEVRPLTNTEFSELASAVRAHVQAAYAAEGRVIAEIDASILTTLSEVETSFNA